MLDQIALGYEYMDKYFKDELEHKFAIVSSYVGAWTACMLKMRVKTTLNYLTFVSKRNMHTSCYHGEGSVL